MHEFFYDVLHLDIVRFQELASCRNVVEQIPYGEVGACRCGNLVCGNMLGVIIHDLASDFIFCASGLECDLRYRRDGGQCFSAESECGDVQQVVCGRYFGCRMSFEAQNRLVRRHAAAVVNDLDQCPSGVAEYHGHLCCSRVHCVLDKFLDYRGRSLYDLSGSNHVGDVAW